MLGVQGGLQRGAEGSGVGSAEIPYGGFETVGGHTDVVRQLREMVILPLMYPEMFKSMQIQPPR